MECGDSSPLFGEGFSLHHLAAGPDGTTMTGRGDSRIALQHVDHGQTGFRLGQFMNCPYQGL